MFKERAIQLKFNEVAREKRMEKDLQMAQDQNRMTEQYKKELINRKRKNEALKRANAETLLKELVYYIIIIIYVVLYLYLCWTLTT